MSQETKLKLVKTLKGALIAGGATAGVYMLQIVGDFNFGNYSEVAVGVTAILINFLRQFTPKV